MAKQSTALSFRYYIWLADTIYTAGRISREQINRKWYRSSLNPDGSAEIPERTFHNWRHAIEDLFEIIIECDRRTGAYYIANADDMQRGGIRTWLVNTFAVNNLINESHQIKRQILFEKIPSGQRFLTTIIEAMRDCKRIQMTYQAFGKEHPATFCANPYCVKVYQQRWYMLALSEGYSDLRIYALDRMQDVEVTEDLYEIPTDFDAEEYFYNVVGVSGMKAKCESVRIKVWDYQIPYLRTLPLHESQREVEKGEDYAVFEYNLVPNFEFRQEIFRNMSCMEVLSPAWLRNEIKQEAVAMAARYNA